MTARDLKLARERGRALPRHHPLYRRKLELPAEHTALAFGHRSLLENCPLFLCLILGVHSTGVRPDNTGSQQGIYRKGAAVTRLERREPAFPPALHFSHVDFPFFVGTMNSGAARPHPWPR